MSVHLSATAMNLLRSLAKASLLVLLVPTLLQAPVYAQDKPVMENVFFNVVWGSAFGATVGVAVSVIGSSDKSAPDDARTAAFQGATAGGVIGLGVALYLVYQGITFDPNASGFSTAATGHDPVPIAENTAAPVEVLPAARAVAARPPSELPPFALVTSTDRPSQITGFTARVLDFRF